MVLSYTEENYIKSIYHLAMESNAEETSTNQIAEDLGIKPATVTSMLKKLRDKNIILYERYGKVKLSARGKSSALLTIRKHRLWEVFLYDKLGFTWDEVHEIAEQLEHIQSVKLIHKLDAFLGYPKVDPHGDPIPNSKGDYTTVKTISLFDANIGTHYLVSSVKDSSSEFLQFLMQLKITLASKIQVIKRMEFDNSFLILVDNKKEIMVSEKFSHNLLLNEV